MAAPTVIIADIDGTTTSAVSITAGHSCHLRLANRSYQNLRTTGLKWNVSSQRCARVNYRTSARVNPATWTASGANANAYYLRVGTSDPLISSDANRKWYANDVELTLGASVAALAEGEYFVGDADTLGYNTVYVRITGSGDPDSQADGYIESDTPLWYLTTAADGEPDFVAAATNRIIYHASTICVEGTITALEERQWAIGDQDTLGFDTIYVAQSQLRDGSSVPTWAPIDDQADGFIYQSYDNTSFAWGAGNQATALKLRWDWYEGDTLVFTGYGFNSAYALAATGKCVCTVENEDGLTSSATVTVTVNAFSGTTAYVAADGDDTTGDGSEGNPYLTLSKAYTVLGLSNSDRRIILGAGTFTDNTSRSVSGSNWIIQGAGKTLTFIDVTATSGFSASASNFTIRDLSLGRSSSSADITLVTNGTGSSTRNVSILNCRFFGYIDAGVSMVRAIIGTNIYNTDCADLSAAGGMGAYWIFGAGGTLQTTGHIASAKLLHVADCSDDYGHRDEASLRWSGDYICLIRCSFEQTNVTTSLRWKSAGPRTVGGTHIYYGMNTFSIPEDTTGKGLNSAQGVAGVTCAPGDGASQPTRWAIVERNKFIGCDIDLGTRMAGTTAFSDDWTIRANVWDFPYSKHTTYVINTSGHYATMARLRIVHNTMNMPVATQFRGWLLDGVANQPLPGTGWVIENNLWVAPLAAVINNESGALLCLQTRTTDTGTTQFSSVTNNVFPVANTDAAAGNYAGTGANTVLVRWHNQAGTATHYWDIDVDVNGTAWAAGNTREAVTLNGGTYTIAGSPTAATQAATRSTGCKYDFWGNIIPATNGPVGAVSSGYSVFLSTALTTLQLRVT